MRKWLIGLLIVAALIYCVDIDVNKNPDNFKGIASTCDDGEFTVRIGF